MSSLGKYNFKIIIYGTPHAHIWTNQGYRCIRFPQLVFRRVLHSLNLQSYPIPLNFLSNEKKSKIKIIGQIVIKSASLLGPNWKISKYFHIQ